MRKTIFLSLFLLVAGCSADNTSAVGADRDAHGCIGSAGYTFSPLKNSCIRLWEAGITLLPAQKQDGAVMAAYAVLQDNKGELFLPGNTTPIPLGQQYINGQATWNATNASGWKLTQTGPTTWQLENNGTLQYQTQGL